MRRGGLLVVGLIVAAFTAWLFVAPSHPAPVRAATAAPVVPTPTTRAPVAPARPADAPPAASAVTALHPSLVVWTSPARSAVRATLVSPNAFGAPLTMLVVGRRPGAYEVSLPIRPNGSTGWVSAAAVRLRAVPYAITIVQHLHRATLWRGDTVVRRFPVAVGKPSTPSPDGRFYVSEIIDNRDGNQAYGPWVVGLSAFSDVYTTFNGGDAQIALHGTDEDATVGTTVSHGCFRMHDADATTLAHLVTLGTPVYVRA